MKAVKYVFHGISKNPKRYILGVLSVVIATLLMVFMGVIFSAGQEQIRELYTTSFDYDFSITLAEEEFNLTSFEIDPVVNEISSISGVQGIYPVVSTLGFAAGENDTLKPTVVYGTGEDYQTGTVNSFTGEYDLSDNNTVVSMELAYQLSKEIGDEIDITLLTANLSYSVTHTFRISGIIDVIGRFPPGVELYLMADLGLIQELIGIQGNATVIYLTVDQDLYDMDNIANPAGRVIDIGNEISLALGPDYRVDSIKSYLIEASFQGVGFFGSFIYIFSIIFPAIAGIMVASILNLSVEEKTQDLAVLRLLGGKRSFVAKIMFIELGLLLVLGLPIGVALGILIPSLLAGGILSGANLTAVTSAILAQVAIAVVVLLLFAVKPILKAFYTNPVDAVRRVQQLGKFKFVSTEGIDKRIFLGSLIIFVALVYSTMVIPTVLIFSSGGDILTFLIMSLLLILVSLCVTLLGAITYVEEFIVKILTPFSKRVNKIIRRNIRRYSRRNLSTNMIFGIIVAIIIFFSTLTTAIQVSAEDNIRYGLGSDILVLSLTPMPMSSVEQIQSIEGVEEASPVAPSLGANLGNLVGPSGQDILLYGVHPDFTEANYVSNDDFHAGSVQDFGGLTNSTIIITRQLSIDLDADVGNTVILEYDEQRIYVTVSAILKSMPGFITQVSETYGGTQACFVSLELYALMASKHESTVLYNQVFVNVESGYDHEDVGRSIKNSFAAREDFFVAVTESTVKMTEEGMAMLEIIFAIILTALLLVAIFSLVMNLYASIIEREYEIGVLKALGYRTSDVLKSLMVEGLAIALASVLIGFVSGIIVAYMVIYWLNVLSPVDLKFWVSEFVVMYLLVASVLASVFATFLTARSAARKPIIHLMRRIE